MTFLKMYSDAMALADKAGSPYFPKSQFDIYANNKYSDWIELMGKMIEKDERYMADMMFLYRTFTKANSNTIDRVTEIPNFRRRIRFYSTYKDCNDVVKTANIQPATNDTIDKIMNDPFNRPIDEDPVAITTQLTNGNPGFQVFSTTTPLSLNLTYIKEPQVINSATSPNTIFECPDYIASYIIRLVVYNLDVTIENFQRAKVEAEEIIPVAISV